MLCFDKLEKNWKKHIATSDAEFYKASLIEPDEDTLTVTKNDINNKLKNIERSLSRLIKEHPLTLDDKAIYDLAGTERADIYHGKLKVEKFIKEEEPSPAILDILNTAFELGNNVGKYNMALSYQHYFEAAQKDKIRAIKSAKKKAVTRKAYYDLIERLFEEVMSVKAFKPYKKALIVEQIDELLQPRIKALPPIRNTLNKMADKGLISIKQGRKTVVDKEHSKILSTYLSNKFESDEFILNINELYQSMIDINPDSNAQTPHPNNDEVNIINLCNTLFDSKHIKERLLEIPIRAISEGIVIKFSDNSVINEEKGSYFKNKIERDIRVKHRKYYNNTIHVTPSQSDKDTFLEIYRLAQKGKVID